MAEPKSDTTGGESASFRETDRAGKIQPFDDAWLGQLVAIYKMIFGQSPSHAEDFTDEQVRNTIGKLSDIWLATVHGEVVGFVGGAPLADYRDGELKSLLAGRRDLSERDDAYFIAELGVVPRFQGAGWGRRLLDHIMAAAMRRGFRCIILQTTIHERNPAVKLYLEQAFRVLLDDRGMPMARIAKQARLDGRPEEDIRVLMVKIIPEDRGEIEKASDERSDFAKAVQRGLMKETGKTLPCKFIYDAYGSQIFEEVCTVSDYYPTQSELNIIDDRSDEIAGLCGRRVAVVEMGSGSSTKTRYILNSLVRKGSDISYFPIDISSDALHAAAAALKQEYPQLKILPLALEYEAALQRVNGAAYDTVLVLWLGTSIGNVEPYEAERILRRIHEFFGHNGVVILGVDIKKDRSLLERAYNDTRGVTSRFNLNLLARMNRELGGHFDMDAFEHLAFYNDEAGRIEMHIVSRRAQTVSIDRLGVEIDFAQGETIHTENSYKFSKEEISALAWRSGFRLDFHWRDSRGLFSVNALRSDGQMRFAPGPVAAL